MRRRDRTGDHANIRAGMIIRRGTVNATLIHGDVMFKDQEKSHKLSAKISAREKENTITELIYWVKGNLTQDKVKSFTSGRFNDLPVFLTALQDAYKALGVEGVKGEYSDFLLFIAGSGRNKIYVSYLVPLTEDHKKVFEEKLGMDIEELGPNLSKLNWRKNAGI